ncbi:hypothetical protein GCM10023196_073860 [Actinoallomurus vinaceus]|uniref:Uncharacterized protein n=1 Tax=Actinoallomurus vinaceus TaxID=1080074 RepID=A0ABP8UMA3_9ACTN
MHPDITYALITERTREWREAAWERRLLRLPRGRRLSLRTPRPRVTSA